jgi:hypothetical protein
MSQNLESEAQSDGNPEQKEKDATETARKNVLSVTKSSVVAKVLTFALPPGLAEKSPS